jgi:hypothetical protein
MTRRFTRRGGVLVSAIAPWQTVQSSLDTTTCRRCEKKT